VPIADREDVVGWAKIPAVEPGRGIEGQDFVSMSGGGGRVLNPNTDHPAEAWALLAFMNSHDAVLEQVAGQARITQRQDVNDETLAEDPLLTFVSEEVLPITATRPGLAIYPQVSQILQTAVEDASAGDSVEEAAQTYQSALEELVGAENVASDG
jgi:multiple sugar transport system substrate-binding protein